MTRRAAMRRFDLAIAAAGLALIGAWEWSSLDLVVARLHGGAHGFAWRHAWLTQTLLHDGGRVAAALLLLALALDAWRPLVAGPSLRERRIGLALTLACLVLVPALKRASLTSCPWELAQFGGAAVYVPHWLPGVGDGGAGHCFPSGHAVAGFAFIGSSFAWRRARPRLACAGLAGALLLGPAFGWAQVARGAHFASHVLWSAWLCWTACALACRWLIRTEPERRARAGHGASPPTEAQPAASIRPLDWHAMRVLAVEDDPELGEAIATGLRQLGHAVDWMRSGNEADAALAAAPYDAVVLDLGLPGGDGMHWLARWRGRGDALPVLVLTARDGVDDRIAGLDGGADDYLVKPIGIDELAARLRALLRRSRGRAQPVWQHGELDYDPAAKTVRWRGAPVELTARELALLEALLAHPGHVMSKARLQEKLYDWSAAEPESNAIEVHVYNLRRKIDSRIVRTIRGVGYVLGGGDAVPDG
jgi:two-component system response regulator QseB